MKKLMILVYAVIIFVNTMLFGFIVPYLQSVKKTMIETTETEVIVTTEDATIPTEIPYVAETVPVETTVPCTTVPPEKVIIKEYNYNIEYKYGERGTPSVEINTSNGIRNNTDDVDTSEYKYLGEYTITGYTPKCKHCCGSTKGITASGVQAITGYTVATHKSIPFGTTLYIEGYGFYVVEDRGVGSNHIDIAANNHDECYSLTNTKVNVYIVPYIVEIVQ